VTLSASKLTSREALFSISNRTLSGEFDRAQRSEH
jgi:hypothetical protein